MHDIQYYPNEEEWVSHVYYQWSFRSKYVIRKAHGQTRLSEYYDNEYEYHHQK